MNETLKTIQDRRSAREFSQRKVSFKTIQKIVKNGQMAPSSGGLQLYTVIFIESQKLKKELGDAMDVQAHAKAAPTWLFICADWHRQKKYSKNLRFLTKSTKAPDSF